MTVTARTLRLWRADERLSLAEAGALFGVTRQTFARWENGFLPGKIEEKLGYAIKLLAAQRANVRRSV